MMHNADVIRCVLMLFFWQGLLPSWHAHRTPAESSGVSLSRLIEHLVARSNGSSHRLQIAAVDTNDLAAGVMRPVRTCRMGHGLVPTQQRQKS